MMKLLSILLLGCLANASFAHELSSQDRKYLANLGQMMKLHAQKDCALRPIRERSSCETEQIKSLAETAASLPGLRYADISAAEFAAMIEASARAYQSGPANAAFAEVTIDCRRNVC
jgi:hypothetical protein